MSAKKAEMKAVGINSESVEATSSPTNSVPPPPPPPTEQVMSPTNKIPTNTLTFNQRKQRLKRNVGEEELGYWEELQSTYRKTGDCLVHYLFCIDASKSMDSCDCVWEASDDPFLLKITNNIYRPGSKISRLESARNSILSFIYDKVRFHKN